MHLFQLQCNKKLLNCFAADTSVRARFSDNPYFRPNTPVFIISSFHCTAFSTLRLSLLYNQRHMYGEAPLQFVRKRLGSCKEDAMNPHGFGCANVLRAVIQQQRI